MSNNEGGYRVGTVARITAGRGVGHSMMAAALLAQALKPKTYVLSRDSERRGYDAYMDRCVFENEQPVQIVVFSRAQAVAL